MDEKQKYDKIENFIRDNHRIVEAYHRCYHRRYKESDFKEQLRVLFVKVLSAGGQGRINENSETINNFEKKIRDMKSPTYSELLKAFEAGNCEELFQKLKSFNRVGPKRSALYLRDILFFGDIILQFPEAERKKLKVPVDAVIRRTMKSIFNRNFDGDRGFDEINRISGDCIFKGEPILLEDMWFWGRFYICEGSKKNITPCKFDRPLLIVDTDITRELRDELLMFADNNKDCPFRQICSRKQS